jgi:hypothetical protein
MALTPSEWDAIQQRAVNPFRSNESNAVNRLTRIITLGQDAILKDNNIESIDFKTIEVIANSYIKDDVYIQFDDNVAIDFTDEGNYYSLTDKGMNRPGVYYLVLHYVYNESIPNPIATIKILKNEEELTEQFILLAKCNVVFNHTDHRYEILSFDCSDCPYVNVNNLKENIRNEFLSLLNFCSGNELRYEALEKRVTRLEILHGLRPDIVPEEGDEE